MTKLRLFEMTDAPKDKTVILAYHKLWKVPMCIRWVDKLNGWTDSVYSCNWPEEAFAGWNYCPEFDI
jgi:hypothetical protein